MDNILRLNFGNQTNDTPQIFSNLIGQRKDRLTYWQVAHLKSAAHEGYLAYKILIDREQQGLPIHARLFFSVYSPLEKFFPKNLLYNKPLFNHEDYLNHYNDLLDINNIIGKNLPVGSEEYFAVKRAVNIIRLQLYGFGRSAIQLAKINHSLKAFSISDLLEKPQVQKHLYEYTHQYESAQKINLIA